MAKYCFQCGEKIDDETKSFCPKCGTQLKSEIKSEKNYKPIIFGLVGVIVILTVIMVIFSGGFNLFGHPTSITILNQSPISSSAEFQVQLSDGSQGIVGKSIEITFKNDKNTYTFNSITGNNGIASIMPNVEAGDYEVTCSFTGDESYSKSTTESPITVTATATEINNQITSTNTEPNYESFSYSNSFEDTDKNGDGYVTLSDMNIAHTPQNIVKKMYADSDDDGDGRLNRHEYYKFMYKLNYDRSSYGL